jgi:hypothetical protein
MGIMNVDLLGVLALAWWSSFIALVLANCAALTGIIIMVGITLTCVVLYMLDYRNKKAKQLPLFPFFKLKHYRLFFSIITCIEVSEGIVGIYLGLAYFQLIAAVSFPIDLTFINIFFGGFIVISCLFFVDVAYRFKKWKAPSKTP